MAIPEEGRPPAPGHRVAAPPNRTGLTPEARETRLEAVTMALYLAIVLLAESIPLQTYSADAREVMAAYAGSGVGLALAHVFAFTLSTRLFSGGSVTDVAWRSAGAQLGAAAGVVAIAALPFLAVGEEAAFGVSGSLLALLIGATGYESARARGSGVRRALTAGGATLLVAAVVVGVKATLAH